MRLVVRFDPRTIDTTLLAEGRLVVDLTSPRPNDTRIGSTRIHALDLHVEDYPEQQPVGKTVFVGPNGGLSLGG